MPQGAARPTSEQLYTELLKRAADEKAQLVLALSQARLQCGAYSAEVDALKQRLAECESPGC